MCDDIMPKDSKRLVQTRAPVAASVLTISDSAAPVKSLSSCIRPEHDWADRTECAASPSGRVPAIGVGLLGGVF